MDNNYYRVKRKEFGHGETQSMDPGRAESYGSTSFRGFYNPAGTGRDYESNAGYRESYDNLDWSTRPIDAPAGPVPGNNTNRGKGPKSYTRTDERILEDINDRMCDNPYLDASDIEVRVQQGEVVLTGTVNNRRSKRLAEDIGEAVTGVKNVENRLRVKIPGI